jgi:hypothetical protein
MSEANPAVLQAVHRLSSVLKQTFVSVPASPLAAVWSGRWQPTLDSILEQALHPPSVAIALVGGTGAGKSTLVNAMLGARILPVSNSRACTAAISEIAYAEGGFAATIEFVSREEWSREVELLLADLSDDRSGGDSPADDRGEGVSRAARDRLKAVYKLSDDAIRPGLQPEDLQEPLDIRYALNHGQAQITAKTVEEFRDQLRRYLDSKYEFWPLVKTARITGPFTGVTTRGVRLVDLPGVNDPNEAREEVTRRYLKEARFVWIVFNIKRALTRDIQTIMLSEDFARQIVMDGRDDALTFVGTASDDVDRESGIEEFDLTEEASESEIVAARNVAVRKVISDQLGELAYSLARSASEPSRANELAQRLQRSKVFTVSARDYLHLLGIAKNKGTTLDDTAQTEIPLLREHLAGICAAHATTAHNNALFKQVAFLISEIEHHVRTEQQRQSHANALTAKKQKEVGDALSRLLNFLRVHLDDHAERFRQEMNAKHELLEERLKRAFERGRAELNRVTEGWKRIHWSTLMAAVRRGGKYNSPTSGRYDFAEDISRPVLESITFAWSDFFGDKMEHVMEVWSDRLVTLADRHRVETLREVTQLIGPDMKRLAKDLDDSLSVTTRLMKEYLGQSKSSMSGRLGDVRSSLYEQIPRQVAANMQAAYAAAAGESGPGVKSRAIGHLSTHAHAVAKVMFDDARDKIMEGVRMVTDSMSRQFKDMTDNAYERLTLPTANFFQSEPAPRGDPSEDPRSMSAL